MRRILNDHARKHLSAQHRAGKIIYLDEAGVVSESRAAELVALDEALTTLSSVDARKAQIVEMRYFGGLADEGISEVLSVSASTITREWRRVKAFLHRELSRDNSGDS